MLRYLCGVLALGLLLCLQACVTGAALTAERQRGIDADKAVHEKNWPQAQIAYKAYIEGRGFSGLPKNDQFRALRSAAFVGLYHGDKNLGYGYLLRVVEMPQAGQKEWFELTSDAFSLKHDADTLRGLIVLAQRWPDQVPILYQPVVATALRSTDALPHEKRLESLWALYSAHFELKWDFEPSAAWRDLSLLLLEENRLAEAVEVSGHITGSTILMEMRADRRFDALVAANPGHFNIEAAAHEELRSAQDNSDAHPQVLELKVYAVLALLRLRDYGAMLAATDEVVLEVRSTNFPQHLYTDYGDQYRSLLELRSAALERLGRMEDAVEEQQAASRLTEEGAKNISQAIDLGDLFCRLSRPRDALGAIADMGPLSPYGAMAIENVRHKAAFQLNDALQVAKSQEFLKMHRADAPMYYELALVRTGQMDLAAQSLIARLRDPVQRQDALKSVQDFPPAPSESVEQDDDVTWKPLIARSDVQAAIRQVGRSESYRLELVD
jgi:tetratricopeptide (TPR) repeat protein